MNKIIVAAALAIGAVSIHASAQNTNPDGFKAKETPGGYEPASPPVPADLPPGTKVVFTPQVLTPDQAYPPVGEPKTYPPCTATRRDECQQKQR